RVSLPSRYARYLLLYVCTSDTHIPCFVLFFSSATPTSEIYTLSLHDALPIFWYQEYDGAHSHIWARRFVPGSGWQAAALLGDGRSEVHTSELQSLRHLVCRLLLEKKKKTRKTSSHHTIHGRAHDRHPLGDCSP